MNRRILVSIVVIGLFTLFLGACARTVVRPETEMQDFRMPHPQQILVYDFAVTDAEVNEGLAKRSVTPEEERQRELGQRVAKVLVEELVRGLRALDFDVERRPRGTTAGKGQLLIDGRLLDVDKGNRLGRIVIGFGAGASKLDTEVDVYYGPRQRKVLEFKTHADSGKLPGAAATMGAGAAVTGGITAGGLAASAASGAVKEYHSEVERMAGHSADQAVAYLSEFFAKQGWIRPDQVKRPKVER